MRGFFVAPEKPAVRVHSRHCASAEARSQRTSSDPQHARSSRATKNHARLDFVPRVAAVVEAAARFRGHRPVRRHCGLPGWSIASGCARSGGGRHHRRNARSRVPRSNPDVSLQLEAAGWRRRPQAPPGISGADVDDVRHDSNLRPEHRRNVASPGSLRATPRAFPPDGTGWTSLQLQRLPLAIVTSAATRQIWRPVAGTRRDGARWRRRAPLQIAGSASRPLRCRNWAIGRAQ